MSQITHNEMHPSAVAMRYHSCLSSAPHAPSRNPSTSSNQSMGAEIPQFLI